MTALDETEHPGYQCGVTTLLASIEETADRDLADLAQESPALAADVLDRLADEQVDEAERVDADTGAELLQLAGTYRMLAATLRRRLPRTELS